MFDQRLTVSAQLLMLVNEWPFREHTHVQKLRDFCTHVRSGLENVRILLDRDMEVSNGSRAPPIQAVLQVHSLTYMNYIWYTRVTTSVSQTSRP